MMTLPSYTSANQHISMSVLPELGAKVVSLRNVRSGFEWMWHPARGSALFRNSVGDPFEHSTLIGADECVPTVDACYWQGLQLPDHGELWAVPWCVEASATAIQTEVEFPLSPLALERRLSLHGNEIHFEYRLTNRSDASQRFLWAFHPLFPLREGTHIELPSSIRTVVPTGAAGMAGVSMGTEWKWPHPAAGIDLSRANLGQPPACAKLFADFTAETEGSVRIRNGRDRLTFLFDPADVPFIGIWITRAAWNGHTHLAIEPTNTGCDSLPQTPETGRTMVHPRGTLSWQFRIGLEAD
jgi:galactose mutarotase-like enzyme